MASAQVLPSSRKQEHLEAGKRRLEEFRKKKAAERAKKTANISQVNASAVSLDQKQHLDAGPVRVTDADGVGTSDRRDGAVETTTSFTNDSNTIDIAKRFDLRSSKPTQNLVQTQKSTDDFKRYDTSGFSGLANANHSQEADGFSTDSDSTTHTVSQGRLPYGFSSNNSTALHPHGSRGTDSSSSESNLDWMGLFQSKESEKSSKDSASSDLQTKRSITSPLDTVGNSIQPSTNFRGSSHENERDVNGNMLYSNTKNSNFVERNVNGFISGLSGAQGVGMQKSESTGFSSDVWISSNHLPLNSATSDSQPWRSRPSFLDSINVSRPSTGMSFQHADPVNEMVMSNAPQLNGMDALGASSYLQSLAGNETDGPVSKMRSALSPGGLKNSMNFPVSSGNGVDLLRSDVKENSLERKHEFLSPTQNEDFAALEQHIEDLTQEKFSMQRALEASRALAESLAAENSSLTDNYNQQRSAVNQLKSDMEKLQEDIKVHLLELESVKIEYANAQLECNAADERAKLLASEVIGLEEKALRLRSNELKLERELENSHAEIASYKKKMSSLEKDRQDLQSTISALQEEKKLLQSKIRKASASGKFTTDVTRTTNNKKDMATSTEDLDDMPDTSNRENTVTMTQNDTHSLPMLSGDQQLDFEESSVYIPPDQMRMIQNITALISDLASEKEELIKALASESSQCSKLKDLNKELSHKLEVQTQRLELLTAQSMANENMPARSTDGHTVQENITYADEGDEVVERVLGWIMKLFPGGPSRRRTSKLL